MASEVSCLWKDHVAVNRSWAPPNPEDAESDVSDPGMIKEIENVIGKWNWPKHDIYR